ncbi:MAG TPA: hypothetical protein VNE39_05645 [Planctomycetota bacterium]|nr:hypothetical protein [Planctomycetota bacterium]
MTRRLLVLVVVLVVVVESGCKFPWSAPAPANPVAILKAADAALPGMALTNVAEWPGPRLFDYMDGAAETYFARRFVTLGSAETKLGKTDARVELFMVKAPADAKALFDDHDDGKGKKLGVGLASSLWEAREMEAIFHRGPYFCRLIIYGSSPEAHKLLGTLAAAIDKSIER